ncbi:ribonuclease III, partial [Patescibacteria group bacterium]|nr:ribonuclease III [Patescibacteria group bacterium]
MQAKLAKLEKILKVKFKNKDLLHQAMVHRSYLNENPSFSLSHNERLEFLGDAVLELVITDYLYNNYSNPEGELTNFRAALVNSDMLAKIANQLGLEEFLL